MSRTQFGTHQNPLLVWVIADMHCTALHRLLCCLHELQHSLDSELLVALTEPARWSDFQSRLDEMQAAAEWDKAEKQGVVRPSKEGVDLAYDAAKAALDAADKELQVSDPSGSVCLSSQRSQDLSSMPAGMFACQVFDASRTIMAGGHQCLKAVMCCFSKCGCIEQMPACTNTAALVNLQASYWCEVLQKE